MDSTIPTHLQRIALLRERRSQYLLRITYIDGEILRLYELLDTQRSSSSTVQPAPPAARKLPEPVFCIPETDWAEQAARSEARKGKPEFRFNK